MMYPTSKVAEATEELALDKPEETSFCQYFAKLPATVPGTIRLFDRGDYYSAHGSDALYIAANVYKTTSVLKYLGPKRDGPQSGLPSCTLSAQVAKSFLRDALTSKQLRIEIYVKQGKKTSNKWEIGQQASPGNLSELEDMLFVSEDILSAPVIAAIHYTVKAGVKTVGVAFGDSSVREIGISEFPDNDLFSNVESLLIQLGIKEVLLPAVALADKENDKAKDYEADKLRKLLARCNVVVTTRKKSEFKTTSIQQDLDRLLRKTDTVVYAPQYDLDVAMSSASALIGYLSLLSDESNHGAYKLLTHSMGQYMHLDASAVRALHLMPDPNMGGGSKSMSIFGILNKCKTAQGTRLLGQWLKQPVVNTHEIEKRQDLVEAFVEDSFMRQTMQTEHLKSIPDLIRLTKKFQKGIANLQDVIRVYQAIIKLPFFIETLKTAGAESGNRKHTTLIEEDFTKPLRMHSNDLEKYQQMVEETIDLEELDNHRYVIKAAFNPDLEAIKEQLDKTSAALDEEWENVAADLGFDTDNKTLHFENHTTYGKTFRLTRKESAAIKKKDNKLKYIELTSKSNGVLFTTKRLKSDVESFKDLQSRYDKKQSSLVKEVVAIAASYCVVLENLNTVFAYLDIIVSLAHVAVNSPTAYVKPTVTPKGEGDLVFKDSRHPCLEAQDDVDFIPNDVELVRGKSEFNIITGPNMGGKSTYIRQIGVIALMAQIGSWVPCTEAKLPCFDAIHARVGAGDSQMKGISTFMAEMLETATILKSATKDSLIIIDELGRGTSTYDGFGLAWSISEHIANEIRCFCVFATHFHELCSLAQQHEQVKNLHVIAQVDTKPDSLTGRDITLLYKVEEGSCDESFGIQVAELASFPKAVVQLAKRKAEDLESFEGTSKVKAALDCDPEVAKEGTLLLRKVLREWAEKHQAADATQSEDDVDMTGDASQDPAQRKLAILKACFAEHKEELMANAWVAALLNQ